MNDEVSESLDDWFPVETKTCKVCLEDKPLSDFYARPTQRSGRVNKCKQCCKGKPKPERYVSSYVDPRIKVRVPSSLLLRGATDVEVAAVNACARAMIEYEKYYGLTEGTSIAYEGVRPETIIDALQVSERRNIQLRGAAIQVAHELRGGPALSWAVRRSHRATREAA